jgi:hypothetical protein
MYCCASDGNKIYHYGIPTTSKFTIMEYLQFQNLLLWNTNNFKIYIIKPLNAKLNPVCPLLALFGDHHILHVSM